MKKGHWMYGKEYYEMGNFVSEIICSNCFTNYAFLGGYNNQYNHCPYCNSYNKEVIYPLKNFPLEEQR